MNRRSLLKSLAALLPVSWVAQKTVAQHKAEPFASFETTSQGSKVYRAVYLEIWPKGGAISAQVEIDGVPVGCHRWYNVYAGETRLELSPPVIGRTARVVLDCKPIHPGRFYSYHFMSESLYWHGQPPFCLVDLSKPLPWENRA